MKFHLAYSYFFLSYCIFNYSFYYPPHFIPVAFHCLSISIIGISQIIPLICKIYTIFPSFSKDFTIFISFSLADLILYNAAKDLTVFSSGVEEQPIKAVPINIVDNSIFKFFIFIIVYLFNKLWKIFVI